MADERSKAIETISVALERAAQSGTGVVCFVRCQAAATRTNARRDLTAVAPWNWVDINASEFGNGQDMLSALSSRATPDGVFLVRELPLPRAMTPERVAAYYAGLSGGEALLAKKGGPRIVCLVSVPHMQALVAHAEPFWRARKEYVAWPEAQVAAAAESVADGHHARAGSLSPDELIEGLTMRLQSSDGRDEKAMLLHRLGLALAAGTRLEEARVAVTKAARLYKDLGNLRELAACYELLASIAERRGDLSVARDWVAFALDSWQALGNEAHSSDCHAKLGQLSYLLGNRDHAAQQFQYAIELDEALGDKAKVSAGLRRLGLMAEEEEKYSLAEKLFRDAAEIVEELNDEASLSRCYHHLGRMFERTGNYVEAFNQHRKSLVLKEKLNDRAGIATSYHHLGNTYVFTREYDQAKMCYERALEFEIEVGDNRGRAATLQQLGEIAVAEHQWEDGLRFFVCAHELWRQGGAPQAAYAAQAIGKVSGFVEPEVIEELKRSVEDGTWNALGAVRNSRVTGNAAGDETPEGEAADTETSAG